jgi:cell division protein FtsI/penicillin-binding protein 2
MQVQSIMRDVVCSGTAQAARVDGWSIAGKTGTAYKAQADGTYFNEDGVTHDYYSSFVGFFPAEDVTVLISIDEPRQGFNSGAQSAAPAFRMLVPTIIHELEVVPPPGSTDCSGN